LQNTTEKRVDDTVFVLFKVDIPDGVTSRPADLCHYYFSFDLFPETTYFMMKQDLILCIFPIEIQPYSENYSD
jgi:hypothetical protein